VSNGTYWACDDRNLVDTSCCLLLEQLFDNETTDVACAYDGEILEARHYMGWYVDEEVSWIPLWLLSERDGGYLYSELGVDVSTDVICTCQSVSKSVSESDS
jgi:hypothetical protein